MSFRVLSQELAEKLSRVRIIPVLSFHSAEESLRLGEILVEGGLCAAEVTTVEYLTGLLVNLRLGWNVWDYSTRPLNVLGQICPEYTLLWFLLSIPGVWLGRQIHGVFGRLRAAR